MSTDRIQIFLLILFYLTACTNPFTTRADKVEKPDLGSSNVEYDHPALNPEEVLSNFEKAVDNKNAVEYMRCFSPDEASDPFKYHFEAEPYFNNELIGIPWTRANENDYFLNLKRLNSINFYFNNAGTPALTLITPGGQYDSRQTNVVPYTLEVSESLDSLTVFKGLIHLRLYESPDGNWYIYYWSDNAQYTDYDLTWTALKLKYRKQGTP